ncbi:DnaT-like ssDNA-binding domain-containing protein [Congregibacter brevis]|uniref:DnaT-like ssDNA-binding domain-containing protein n=1 Tax=Congregibacter brevis TaxID=3081201 RepID=A0ABZ0IDC8_9GAMM|nr:DnaT-like ssDNA-binding domain-containing protein [Congregibacter sp. IMCC45268]
MAPRPLIPDSQLVFSAELAAAVGLAEAVLLQQIKGLYLHQPSTRRDGLAWLHVSRAYLLQLLPFWNPEELQSICDSLESLGLLSIDRKTAAQDSLLLAINEAPIREPAVTTQAPKVSQPAVESAPAPMPVRKSTTTNVNSKAVTPGATTPRPSKRTGEPLPPDFQPSEDMLELLERFHGVPRGFALQQTEDFTLYWRERGSAGHAWQNRFKQHVQFQWARQQQESTGVDNAGQRGTGAARRTRDSSLESDLTDTSWAE